MSDTTNEPTNTSANTAAEPPRQTGVTMQKPLIIGLLYLLNIVLGFSVFVGLILAYVWRSEADVQEWEKTHYSYLIRTFWISFVIAFVTFLAWFGSFFALVIQTERGGDAPPAMIGMFFIWILVWFALAGWFCVRCILSMIKAGSQQPMPKPKTWLF